MKILKALLLSSASIFFYLVAIICIMVVVVLAGGWHTWDTLVSWVEWLLIPVLLIWAFVLYRRRKL